MTELFFRFFSISVTVCTLSLLVILFFGAFGKRFSAKCRYFVWSILILRLLVPVGGLGTPVFNVTIPPEERPALTQSETVAETSVHVENTVASEENTPEKLPPVIGEVGTLESGFVPPASEQTETLPSQSIPTLDEQTDTPSVYVPELPEADPVPDVEEDAVKGESAVDPVPQNPAVTLRDPAPSVNSSVPVKVDSGKNTITLRGILDILSSVWLLGAAVCFAVKLGEYISYSCALKRYGTPAEPTAKVREIYAKAVADSGLKRAPKLRVSSDADSPMLVGFFNPTVILSEVSATDEGLYRIITHELTHYRRGDLWIKLLCATAESVYWFNPFVRIITAKCVGEMELSCDEATLAGLCDEERISYGEAVLAIVKNGKKKSRSSLTTSFSAGGNSVKKRFEGIIDGSRKRKGTAVVATVLVLCMISGSLFAYSEEKPQEKEKNTETTATETEKNKDTDTSVDTGKNEDNKDTDNSIKNEDSLENTDSEDGNNLISMDDLDFPLFVVKAYSCRDAYYDKPYLSSYGHEVNYRVYFADDIEGYDVSVCKIRVCDDGCSDGDIVGAALSGNARAYDLEYLYELPAESTNHPIKVFKWSLPEAMYDEYPDGENDSEISDYFRSTMYLVNVSENVHLVLRLDPKEDTPRSENERELMDKLVSGIEVRDTAHSEGKHHRYEVYVHKRSNVYIYDSDGNIVYEEYNDLSNVSVEETDGLVVIKKGLGNGPMETKYYSTEKNIISDDYYYDVAAYDDGKIIYADGSSGIVIKSIFDSSVYHYIEDRLDIKWRLWCIKNAYFEDGKAVVEYRYFEAEDSEESSVKTVVVDLGKEDTSPNCEHSHVRQGETPATCTVEGSVRYACEYCGAEAAYTEILPKTEHTLTSATCTAPSVCTVCSLEFSANLEHVSSAPTCTAPAVCTVCGVETASAAGHDFAPATTTSPKTCRVCGVTDGWPAIEIDTSGALGEHQFSAVELFYNHGRPVDNSGFIPIKYVELTVGMRLDSITYSVGEPDADGRYPVTFYYGGEITHDERWEDSNMKIHPMITPVRQTEENDSYYEKYVEKFGHNGNLLGESFYISEDSENSSGGFMTNTVYMFGGCYTLNIKDGQPYPIHTDSRYAPLESEEDNNTNQFERSLLDNNLTQPSTQSYGDFFPVIEWDVDPAPKVSFPSLYGGTDPWRASRSGW